MSVPVKDPFEKVVSEVVRVPSAYMTHLAARAGVVAIRPSRTEEIIFIMSSERW